MIISACNLCFNTVSEFYLLLVFWDFSDLKVREI